MDEVKQQIDPNMNAEAYRNLAPPVQSSEEDQYLEVISSYGDDSLILGSSNMTSRYWTGTVWYYSGSPADFKRTTPCVTLRTETGICAASFLGNNDTFIIGEDSGVIQILQNKNDTECQGLQCKVYVCGHTDSVSTISPFQNSTKVATGGLDCTIKIWDMNEKMVTNSFYQAHLDSVTCIDTSQENYSVFVSSSLDCEALMWDLRKEKPCFSLYPNSACPISAICFKPDNNNIVAIGGHDGRVSLFDTRNLGLSPMCSSNEFSRPVHKLLFNHNSPGLLAGCCDSEEIVVFDVFENKLKTIVEDSTSHSDFVRGLTWHNNDLITCSWDNQILKHQINVT